MRVWLRRVAGAIFAFVAGAAYFFAFPGGAPGGASSTSRDRWTDLGVAVAIGLAALAFFVILEIAEARRKRAMQDPLARWDDSAARRRRRERKPGD
jgi:uncharacterized membrane protein